MIEVLIIFVGYFIIGGFLGYVLSETIDLDPVVPIIFWPVVITVGIGCLIGKLTLSIVDFLIDFFI